MPRQPVPRTVRSSATTRRPRWLIFLLGLALLLAPNLMAAPAYAEGQGELTIDKTVDGFTEGQQVQPGDTFVYTVTITCTNINSGGCTNAQLTDPIPDGLSLNPDASAIAIQPAGAGTASADGNDVTVDFTQPLTDPVGGQGIQPATTITVKIPVKVDDDISPDLDGKDLTNKATVDADNADPKSDSFVVVPDVPTTINATTDKSFDPDSAVANPGTETTMTLTGGNADSSNVPVDEIVITDPNDPPGPPGAFEYLALTGDFDVTLPAGAEQVQVDCYVNGQWVDGAPGADPALPDSVDDPADCDGVRVHFISTDGANIQPGASGSIDVTLEQRDNIADAGEGAITNEVSTTASNGDNTSDPVTADDDYTIQSGDIDLDANKKFDPATIAAGSDSTVTIGATNSSSRTLDSMTVTEPGADPNMFTDGSNPVTFDGWGDPVQWPQGATGASVTYTYANPPSPVTVAADEPNTLPDPAPGRTVTGFTVTFTGPIVPGAEASIPFDVTADPDQTVDSLDHPNTIDADSTAPGGYHGHADADATLTTLKKRLAIDTGKTVLPSQIFGIPGQQVLVELSGKVEDFPASTTDANDIVITDPADFGDDGWYDAFSPTGVINTPIPAGATLTVQYWDGTEWVDVPGMTDIPGPQTFSGTFPDPIPDEAQGIRFDFHSDDGFPPGTEVNPNIGFKLKDPAPTDDVTINDCASSSASGAGADDAQGDPACDDIHVVPPSPGNGDFIDKAWDDPAAVSERSQEQKGATISWSTNGATGITNMVISDTPDTPGPSVADLPSSVYDSFDLVRIDPIDAAMDPRLKYDQILSVQLYSASQGAWIDAPGDPCPAACDKTFPGYNLSADSQADTIAFRLTYAESPNRVVDNALAPPIGSGVAVSIDNNRHLHPVFQIRDDLRSDPNVPVLAEDEYNIAGETGVVRNTAQARLVVGDNDDYYHQDDSDDIAITPVEVTSNITKDWTGGPLGVPEPGTATFPDEYPTANVTLKGSNTTPSKVDTLTITDPTSDDPFENFNLAGFTGITDPASIGATGLTVTLKLADGSTETMTRDEALAAAESDLADVVGFSFAYTGRINAGAEADITFVTRVRDYTRSSNGTTPVETPQTVPNDAAVDVADLVNYPDVTPRKSHDTDDADIDLNPAGIGLDVTKTISPDSQTEPDDSPVNVTLTGQPSGPSRTVEMILTDDDTTFFNAYDFVGFGAFGFTGPIDQVQVDAYVGGTFTAAGNTVVRTGGNWVTGTPGTSLALPDGVTADQVQGLRFTFTKADGSIWENPSTPNQPVTFQVQRRADLRSGGPVLSDLAGNDPMPGEQDPGVSTDTIQGDNYAADTINGQPLHGHDDATDEILYKHANNAVEVTKDPSGAQPPGQNIPYTLAFTNTGAVPITNPVITDTWASDADGPLLQYDPDRDGAGTGYTYDLAGAPPDPESGPQLPTGSDPTDVAVAETGTSITFTFPEGTVLEVGQTYTITTPLQFRTGLPGNTDVTNTTGISGDRAWDNCKDTLDDDTGECQASTTVYPVKGGALRGVKSVKAVDDELGVLNTRDNPDGCTPNADGFYVGGCVPVTKPGKDDIWRMTFTNTGNLPQDKVYAIDRLPTPGDTGAITSLERGSQWTPTPKSIAFAGVTGGTVSQFRVYYDTDQDLCTDDLDTLAGCPDGAWTLAGTIDDPPVGGSIVIPANATAIQVQASFDTDEFQPAGTISYDLTTTAPAQSPTAGPDTIAWNTVAAAAETDDNGTKSLSPKSEGNKVGVALATGPLSILKQVDGGAAEYAQTTFDLTVHCTSVGEDVDLGDNATITVTAGEPYEIDDVPWGSECTVSEDDAAAAGNPDFHATTVTVGRDSDEPVQIVATNTYLDASLSITKDVTDSAVVDADGNPITYGPFTFDVSCSYLDQPVYAAGYDADDPMTATFDSGETVTFTELPAGSECTATESDTDGAASTTSEGTTGAGTDDEQTTTGTDTIDLVLTPDGDGGTVTNTVTFTNVFATGSLTITKSVEGDGADLYGAGPFIVHLACTDEDGTSVYDNDFTLGGDQPLSVTVTKLYVVSTCEVTETEQGGATSSTVSPEGPFQVTADSENEPVQITVTNTFDVGAIRLIKQLDGGGADDVASGTTFTLQVTCQQVVDGETVPVPLPDDGAVTLTTPDDLTATIDDLPTGASCTITETDNGGADDVSIDPGQVTVGDGTTVDVRVVNTFDAPPPNPPNPPLPNTGGPGLGLMVVGGLLLIGGGASLVVARRRRA